MLQLPLNVVDFTSKKVVDFSIARPVSLPIGSPVSTEPELLYPALQQVVQLGRTRGDLYLRPRPGIRGGWTWPFTDLGRFHHGFFFSGGHMDIHMDPYGSIWPIYPTNIFWGWVNCHASSQYIFPP